MAENLNSFGGVVGTVAVTAVNSMPPPTGTFVHAQDAGMLGQVKMTPVSNVVFQNSSNVMVGGGGGETPFYTSNMTDSSMCDSAGHTPQVDTISVTTAQSQSSGVDGMMNTGAPAAATLPVTSNVKKTSFQITSVTVDSSASNDGGDDSADDLDESHTEDSSDVATDVSRHTSESRVGGGSHATNDDNFTRNDIFYNPAPPSSMNIAPVIPTSSQYGLAIVPEGLNPVTEVPPPAPAIMNDPAGDKADPDKDIVHNRFKVVKIVSTEPFKKGRWMCMDYFDHTTTNTGTTSSTAKDNPNSQTAQQQGIPQSQQHSNIPQPLQSTAEKVPLNVVNVQGSNVPMTSSPPQQQSNIHPDSQQQTAMMQQSQPSQHVMQTQMQNNMHDPEGSINSSGLSNGNGTHYHVNHAHNVQGVNMNHVAPASNIINSNVNDTSAFNTSIQNHNPVIPTSGSTYQNSMGQQQQQYYNYPGDMTGIPPSITNQQQQNIAPQQQSMTSQQPSRPMTGQVPLAQNQTQPQTMGQIGPQSSISQNTSVPLLTQTMSASQMHQAPVQVTQPSHLPAQSLPHGAHAQMTGSGSINTQTGGSSAPQQQQQQQQQHAGQSLGHNMLQQSKPAFMNPPQHQQSQAPAPTQFQQQPNSQQQQQQQQQQMMSAGSEQTVMGSQQNYNPQAPQVGQVSQTSNQQQQPQNYQTGVMMQGMPGIQQQVHVSQMNASGVNQHSVQMQQNQPSTQNQGMYSTQGQMMGHSMPLSGQSMNIQQNTQPLMQQQNVIQNQTMMQQQPQMVGQQHHQQMMGMTPQQQPMVSQNQANAPQQPIMSQPQMMSQMMQNTQMSGMVTQTPLVSQPGVMSQQQGIMPSQNNMPQPNMIQQMPQQSSYPSQTQPQTINNQPPMQQPIIQQYPQAQPNPIAQQQQMMPPQNQSNIMAPQMTQPLPQGQQQIPLQQQQQPSQQSQQQSTPPQQQPTQMSMPSQPQQNVFQNTPPQMQVSQSSMVSNMSNMQPVHNIMPPSSQSIPQLPTSTGMPLQANDSNSNVSISNTDTSNQQQQQPQSIVQQQPTPAPVSNVNQVQSNPAPVEVHHTSQSQPVAPQQVPPASTTASSAASPAITSLSAAATVIIDGVNSLGDASASGNSGNEDGESATGTNTVAIDNKIEQAMDLVKSHLMFAVREEVEVLKEKISELMERITQLEYENNILRANASQETLAQLQKSTQHPSSNVNEGHQGFS